MRKLNLRNSVSHVEPADRTRGSFTDETRPGQERHRGKQKQYGRELEDPTEAGF